LLTPDLIRKISKLKKGLNIGFFAVYRSFEEPLMLPPENWRSMAELQQDLVNGLERICIEDPEQFVLSVGKIQRLFDECYPQEKNNPIPLKNYKARVTNLPFNSV